MLPVIHPVALHERPVVLLDSAFPHRLLKPDKRLAGFTDNDGARGIAVQPVREFKKRLIRAARAEPLDEPERDPAAAVAGKACRLIDDQEMLVLEEDRERVV